METPVLNASDFKKMEQRLRYIFRYADVADLSSFSNDVKAEVTVNVITDPELKQLYHFKRINNLKVDIRPGNCCVIITARQL